MKNPLLRGVSLSVAALILSASAQAADVHSLRGAAPLDSDSLQPSTARWERDRAPIQRDYTQQPPLIPHSIEGYTVNMKFNKCMTCHSWATYQRAKATKISQTHFADRNGNDLADVSARRYFCTQCHVPQKDAQPLVENTFEPVIGSR